MKSSNEMIQSNDQISVALYSYARAHARTPAGAAIGKS